MALSTTVQASPLAGHLVEQTATTASANNNVIGGSGTLYLVDVDNTAVGAATYVKIYDSAAPTIGTTAADYVVKIPANTRRSLGIIQGFAFTNLSFAAVTGAAESSVISPGGAVIVRLLTS